MKGDFTRSTFDAKKHYSGVRMQQGRVQLDADWNEQADINRYHRETEAKDVLGPTGVPINKEGAGDGFRIQSTVGDLRITAGNIYVDGILCENPEDVLITGQDDLPNYSSNKPSGKYLAYLDVWQLHITALEDPQIREVALGGPDTATRTKTVWQVKLLSLASTPQPANKISVFNGQDWLKLIEESGTLSAFNLSVKTAKPCEVPPGAGYRRLENQLYRVEIHKEGGQGNATFKWSRDNGSVVFPIEIFYDKEPKKIRLASLSRDKTPAIAPGQWVEIMDDSTELWGEPGIIALVEDVDVAGRIVTLNRDISGKDRRGQAMLHPRLRRWDMPAILDENKHPLTDLKDGIPVTTGDIELEDGIFVSFDFDGKKYRTGDYWLIPARTETGTIEWPEDKTKPHNAGKLRPMGIRHHYCGLALLDRGASWNLLGELPVDSDCRPAFPAVTDLTSFSYVSGDGQEAMPGNELPEPLRVGVSNGRWPVDGAKVRFVIEEGSDGSLIFSGGVSPVRTVGGIAECRWRLGDVTEANNPVPPLQRVKAVLLDANDQPVHLPVYFNANLSVASQVAYKPTPECSELAEENENPVNLRSRLNISDETYSSVADVLDALLCRFNADDLPIEKNDDLCKSLKDDVNIKTVQNALNKLCRDREGMCTYIIGPGTGWESIFGEITEGQDAKICFQVGTYTVNEPIVLANKGHLIISGCGSGTRIRIPGGETTFRFEACKSVVIKDLYCESGAAGHEINRNLDYLNGTLTFCACPHVTIESVELKCAAGAERAASCINVRDAVEYPQDGAPPIPVESVHIHNCDLHIGHMQTGILLINVLKAHVEDNFLDVSTLPEELSLAMLLKNRRYRSAIRSLMIFSPHQGKAENGDVYLADNVASFKAGKGFAWFKTDPIIAREWGKLNELDKPKGVQSDRDLVSHLINLADRALLNEGRLQVNDRVFDGFRMWYERLNRINIEAGSQGIAVGGSTAGNINIINNRIQGFMQGIHVGVSHRGVIPDRHDTAGIVHIINNSIDVVLPSSGTRERHGIFVGNCGSLIIQDNYAVLARSYLPEHMHIDGIRVHGHTGRMMIIRQNHIVRFSNGIHFWPVNDVSGSLQWIITDNMAQESGQDAVMLLPEEWNEEWSEEKKKKIQDKTSQLRKIIRGLNYNFK